MVKLWSRLCFLVLAVSFISRGQTGPSDSKDDQHPKNKTDSSELLTASPSPLSLNTTVNEVTTPPTSFLYDHALSTTTHLPVFTTQNDSNDTVTTTEEILVPETTVPASGREEDQVSQTTVSMTTSSTSPEPSVIIENTGNSSWVYVILVFIILAIVVLCVILYYLRRVSRTYSFDLQRPSPATHHNEPTGTFEPVYLDDLDQPAPKNQVTPDDLSPPPVTNGTTLQSEEKGSNGDIAPKEQPEANGLASSPTSHTSLSLGDDPAEKTSSSSSITNLFFDAVGKEQQNENNNNPSVCSSDPFVEINLDDPACCDQLLTSPEAPSSVLPFSPFSFSSSSSSSS